MDIRVPQLAEGVTAGTVVSVLVTVGEQIAREHGVIELETSKAIAPIPSPAAGTVTAIHVQEGDEVAVGQVIVTLSDDGAAATPSETTAPRATPATDPAPPPAMTSGTHHYESSSGVPPPASPSVRKIARELDINLAQVTGSARGGRILIDDVRAYVRGLQQGAQAPSHADQPMPVDIDFAQWGPVRAQKMSSLRRTISEHLTTSWRTIPHVTQFHDIDVTDIVALSKQYAEAYTRQGGRLTLTPFVLRAVVATLKQHPIFNTSFHAVAGEIVHKDYYHIGIAVNTGQGLIVPVVRDVDTKTLLALSIEVQQLAEKARQRTVSLDELQGGTFTISNQGGIGGTHFTPIIHAPQVAILGLGRARRMDGRLMMPIGLSYDHRIIDGAQAAQFVVDLATALSHFTARDVQP